MTLPFRNFPIRSGRSVAALTVLAAVAACTPVTLPPPLLTGDGQDIAVEEVPTPIVVGRGGIPLGRLTAALHMAARGRFDALHLELHGRDRRQLQAVVRTARRAGVDPLKIVVVPGFGPPGAVEVIASRFVTLAPVCPSLAIVDPSVNDNDFEPTLGCSTRRNLAAMINDPADLLGSDAVVPGDGAYAVKAVERYRSNAAAGRRGGSGGGTVQAVLNGGSPPTVLGADGPVTGGAQP